MKRKLVQLWSRTFLGKALNVSVRAAINGKSFTVPLIKGLGADHLTDHEPWLSGALKKLLSVRKGKFVDVGVNIGQTLLKVKAIDPDVDYVGFEPNPTCLFYLQELIRENNFKKVTIMPYGLADRSFIADLTLYAGNADSSATIITNFRATPGRTIKVPIVSAAEANGVFAEPIGVVKIDVEGAELAVIAGLQEAMKKYRPSVICEILPVYTTENVSRLTRQNALAKILDELSYVIYRISIAGILLPMDTLDVHDNLADVNYLFLPREEADAIVRNW